MYETHEGRYVNEERHLTGWVIWEDFVAVIFWTKYSHLLVKHADPRGSENICRTK